MGTYLLFILPAVLLGLWAQMRIRATYAQALRVAAPMDGATAAREILKSAGLYDVKIEQVAGTLSDHYDPRRKVLRLSRDVYQTRSMAAVGIAAHEAGHALQDATQYGPLLIRNAAVPLAGFGSNFGVIVIILGAVLQVLPLLLFGIGLFACVVIFQLVNLPVEFNASARAKQRLAELGIVPAHQMGHVNKVLNAAAWTYVAATLQAILTLLYYVMIFLSSQRRR